MKKHSLAMILLVFAVWLQGQTVVILTPGQISVGAEVHFRFDHEGGGGASTYSWNYGDGSSETTGNNQGHHAYMAAGNYTVTCTFTNMGAPPASGSITVTVVDNRRIFPQGNGFRQGKRVSFQAENFASPNLRWDFGDGTVESGQQTNGHVYANPGNYTVKAFDFNGDTPLFSQCQVAVEPDNRQLQAVPSPPRAGQAVQFTAGNFSAGDLRWSFGDGKTENGGPVVSHVYAAPGTVQLQVWEMSDGQDSALKTSLAVQPDLRQLVIGGPADIFAGSEVVFEGRNFTAPGLKWDFGDGTVEPGGLRQAHRFPRPGSFLVKVVEADSQNLPLEKRLQVLNDNRALVVKTSVVFANSEFEIEAQNFRGGSVSWDFGDGPLQSGQRLMKHRYAHAGQFRVRAVDFAGRDGKFFEKIILAENDSREIRLPAEIIAGEEIALQLQNAGPGSFNWKFSDGDTRSGPELRAKAFRSPGPHKITVVDSAGKYPPLEKTVQVLPDTRSLKSSSGFILPKEAVTFTAWNFRGPGVRWDFGDGTVKENGQVTERHEYAALGRYQVKAVDFNGRSSRVFKADVVVADMTPGFEISALEFAFDTGKYYRVVAKNSPAPGYGLRIKARGRGVLTGQFMLDNMSIGLFQLLVQENQAAVLPKAQMSALPMSDLGLHELTLKFTNYSFNRRIPIIKYFVSAAGAIQIVSPLIDAKVPVGDKVTLRWAIERKKPLFEIAVSEVPFQFLGDKQVTWLPLAGAATYLFDPAPYKPGTWIYWQVRLLNESKQVQTTSEIASFKLSE
jgi:PKD repeat protein